MAEEFKLNGVVIEEEADPRDYTISQFVPGDDIIPDTQFSLALPEKQIILNQYNIGACVGFSFAMAKQIQEFDQSNKWIELSPFMIYGTRYAADKYNGVGMIPRQGAKVLYNEGAFLKRDFNIAQEVPQLLDTVSEWKIKNPDKVKEAEKLKISGYSFVYNEYSVKKALKNKMPVSAAWKIYPSFYETKNDGLVPVPKASETCTGSHEMTIVGWTNDCWIVVNSWGANRGFKGMYLIPFEYNFTTGIAISDNIMPATYKAKNIELTIGKKEYKVDGTIKELDVAPYQKNDRSYVPVRFVTEALGASVEWNNDTEEVTIRSEEKLIKLTIGSKKLSLDNVTKYIDVEPELVNDRTMVPIRAIAEALNCKVDWNEETKTIFIKSL